MTSSDSCIDWLPGVPRAEGGQFIQQLVVDNPKGLFRLELTGQVICSGGTYLLSILPMGSVVLRGHEPERYGIVHIGILDQTELTIQLAASRDALSGAAAPASFALSVASTNVCFGDVVEAAEKNGLGCQCAGRPPGLSVSVEIVLGSEDRSETFRSKPIRGIAVPVLSKYPPSGTARAFAVFACYSVWEGMWEFGGWTYCRGSGTCPAGEGCFCDGSVIGSSRPSCEGWDTCWCH